MARRGDKLREHILWIAKEVFLEMGFERASMDLVARRAETSKRSLIRSLREQGIVSPCSRSERIKDLFEVSARRATKSIDARSKPISRNTSLAIQRICSRSLSPLLAIAYCRLLRSFDNK